MNHWGEKSEATLRDRAKDVRSGHADFLAEPSPEIWDALADAVEALRNLLFDESIGSIDQAESALDRLDTLATGNSVAVPEPDADE